MRSSVRSRRNSTRRPPPERPSTFYSNIFTATSFGGAFYNWFFVPRFLQRLFNHVFHDHVLRQSVFHNDESRSRSAAALPLRKTRRAESRRDAPGAAAYRAVDRRTQTRGAGTGETGADRAARTPV